MRVPAFASSQVTVYEGDVLEVLRDMADESVDCVVTSPPYWGLRDYGVPGQIGLERTPPAFVAVMVEVFREVRRVMRERGTLWLNLGDSYLSRPDNFMRARRGHNSTLSGLPGPAGVLNAPHRKPQQGIKPKDMVGIPWRVAFALQEDGWYLRSEIIWHKPNAMPEAVKDRPTKAHETVFLLTKSARYHYDADAIAEPASGTAHARGSGVNPKARIPSGWDTGPGGHRQRIGRYPGIGAKTAAASAHPDQGRPMRVRTRPRQNASFSAAINELVPIRNSRTVWTIPTQPHPEAHFATFPDELARRCIAAGCPSGGTVLDPFAGSGTTLAVARDLGRRAVGIELHPEYVRLIEKRCAQLALEAI